MVMPMPHSLDPVIHQMLMQKAEAGRLRARRIVQPLDAVHVEIDGRRYTNFCSNDYLGLMHHPRTIAAMQSSVSVNGVGTGAAGLISGFTTAHANAEASIAKWKGTESAILLPSGYQANQAAIQTLSAIGESYPSGVRFLIDKLAHASLVDAVRGSDKPWRVFPHNGLGKLRRLLSEADSKQLQVVVTESIFSMDGDAADLAALAEIKTKTPYILLLDEAHGSGVYGPGGAGLAAELGLSPMVDISIATFSKAAGCMGGAICASREFCDAVLNYGRAYIFSTSVPASIADAIATAIAIMGEEPQRARRVRDMARQVRSRLQSGGMQIPAGDSPIIPIIVGEEEPAMEKSQKLFERRFLVQAVRPPTVAAGTSRLRVTLSCEHSDSVVNELVEALLK
jgi:8-amino-7-oxononanoate synthase